MSLQIPKGMWKYEVDEESFKGRLIEAARHVATASLIPPSPPLERSVRVLDALPHHLYDAPLKAALIARAELGARRYGQYLHSFNFRDARIDLAQELMDAVFYVVQLQTERRENNKETQSLVVLRVLMEDHINALIEEVARNP